MRALVVYNKRAGAGRAERLAKEAERRLTARGDEVVCEATRPGGGATHVVAERAAGIDLLVVAGGDGSLREAIVGLGDERERVTMGFLPVGHGNVVARDLGIPVRGDGALDVLTQGTPTLIDLGRMNGEVFLAMVGIGWDADACHYLHKLRHTWFGRPWYRYAADVMYGVVGLAAMLRPLAPRFALRLDGAAPQGRYSAAILSSIRTYAKDWSMCPDADVRDGKIHYNGRKRTFILWTVLHLVYAKLRRRSPDFIADYGQAERITIESERPMSVQCDGDYAGRMSKVEIEVLPGALSVLVVDPASLGRG